MKEALMRLRSMRTSIRLSAVIVLTLVAGACTSGTSSQATTAPTPATSTETFSGNVAQLATDGHPFSVSAAGTVTIGLTSVAPLATMSLGVGIGTWDGTACGTSISKNDNARAGSTALSGTATVGNYCVLVYDSGNIQDSSSVSYVIAVAHP